MVLFLFFFCWYAPFATSTTLHSLTSNAKYSTWWQNERNKEQHRKSMMVKIINHGKVMDNSKLHDKNRFCNITIQRKCCKMPKITFVSLENHFCQLTLTPSVWQQMRNTNNADILVNFCFIRLSFYIFMGDELCDFDGHPYAKIGRNLKRFLIEQKNGSTKITKNLIQNVLFERM